MNSHSFTALALLGFTASALANPDGMTVVTGNVGAVATGSTLDIFASANSVINWQSFNIGAGETTTFHQPDNISVVWNQITDQNPSQIWGHLNGNGIVVLMNQSGFYFGPNSSVNVGGFVAASAFVTPPSSVGGMWSYQGPPPVASIVNYGEIKAANGGSIFLVAEKIENHGVLTAPDGTLGLYAGKNVLISERPDGRGLSMNVALPEGSIDNVGKISADAGEIALHARVVNQNGIIQANSVRERNGVIELVANDELNLGANSVISANGDSAVSAGGEIKLISSGTFADTDGSRVEVRGGAMGGNGGNVEISAPTISEIHTRVDGAAQVGNAGGKLLIDPTDLTLNNNSLAPFVGLSAITFQATHNITFASSTVWNLSTATGVNDGALTLQAGNNITFGNGARITDANNWSVTLQAGYDFVNQVVQNGVGSIYLNGGIGLSQSGAIETGSGNLVLQAGHDVLVGSGFVRTIGGGNIFVTAGDGDVDAGKKADTYQLGSGLADVISANGLGGIGTANGGNVTVSAGRDVSSINASIGAFGATAGNVNVAAGRNLQGTYVVRNGIGSAFAANDIGTGAKGASFGLIGGGWTIEAMHDAFIKEIYNPNGAFNSGRVVVPTGVYPGNVGSDGTITLAPVRQANYYNYALNAYANIIGHNSVRLIGTGTTSRSAIYAPIVDIFAGVGGLTLGSDVTLFPSALGHLAVVTSGDLASLSGQFYKFTVSDSGLPAASTFANDHAVTPIHNGQTAPVLTLAVGGSLRNVGLVSAGAADVRVDGDAINTTLDAQHVAINSLTRFLIGGDYTVLGNQTSVVLSEDVAAAFSKIFLDDTYLYNSGLAAKLSYDATTHTLKFKGIMSDADLNFLLHPLIYKWDAVNGYTLDQFGQRVTEAATLTTDTASLNQLFADSQSATSSDAAKKGFAISGPGTFQFAAHDLNLGSSDGITSLGVLKRRALDAISLNGVDLQLALAGDLNMNDSTIGSFGGGDINIFSGGTMSIGPNTAEGGKLYAKGIYTSHGGNVTLHALGDVLINGSRVAAYDGGDVNVTAGIPTSTKDGSLVDWSQVQTSLNGILYVADSSGGLVRDKLNSAHDGFDPLGNVLTDAQGQPIHGYLVTLTGGDVNSGSGGKGYFLITTREFNPLTGLVENHNTEVFGGGILAFTREDSSATVGNLLVNAGHDIVGGSSGFLEIPFNALPSDSRYLSLNAGHDIRVTDSGVVGVNTSVSAVNEIIGKIVGSATVALKAETLTVTALGPSVSSSGDSSKSTLIGNSVSQSDTGGGGGAEVITTGGGEGGSGNAFAGAPAPAAQKTTEDADKTVAAASTTADDEEELKKKRGGSGGGGAPVLAQKVSRVTVILPNKS